MLGVTHCYQRTVRAVYTYISCSILIARLISRPFLVPNIAFNDTNNKKASARKSGPLIICDVTLSDSTYPTYYTTIV